MQYYFILNTAFYFLFHIHVLIQNTFSAKHYSEVYLFIEIVSCPGGCSG